MKPLFYFFLILSVQPVALGWGSKSTQFHGSLGKSAAQSVSDDLPPQTQTTDNNQSYFEITWRGDGAFFAISYASRHPTSLGAPNSHHLQSPANHLIKIYSRSASLISTSTNIKPLSLHGPIAWRPEGSIIAAAAQDPNSQVLNIIFFERNGLQRYGFDLKPQDQVQKIWAMAWNADSTLLAIGVEKNVNSTASASQSRSSTLSLIVYSL